MPSSYKSNSNIIAPIYINGIIAYAKQQSTLIFAPFSHFQESKKKTLNKNCEFDYHIC